MNLRISNGQLRYRISREELKSILQGEVLELSVALPHKTQCHRLQVSELTASMQLDSSDNGLRLIVDKSSLETFSEQLPSREGMEYTLPIGDKNLLLVLEVDVRKSRVS